MHVSTLEGARPYSRYLTPDIFIFFFFILLLVHIHILCTPQSVLSGGHLGKLNRFRRALSESGVYLYNIKLTVSQRVSEYQTPQDLSCCCCYYYYYYYYYTLPSYRVLPEILLPCPLHDPPSSSPRTSLAPSWHPLNNNNFQKLLPSQPPPAAIIQTSLETIPGLFLASSTILRHRLRRQ